MGLPRAIILLGLVSCAAQPERPRARTAGVTVPMATQAAETNPAVSPELVAKTEGVAEEATRLQRGLELLGSGDYGLADPLLREELATGPGFREAALALAAFYRGREGHVDAESILKAALARDPESEELNLMHARVCSETNRWLESSEILRALIPMHPESVAPRLALVVTERALGRLDQAALLLDQIMSDSVGDPLVQKRIEDFELLAEDLAEERRQGRRLSRTANELYAQLRAGESLAQRKQALNALIARASTHSRAVMIAYQQPDALLRVMAIRAWPVAEGDLDDLANDIGILFADPDARVRAEVSALARRWASKEAAELLLTAMENEQNGYAFRTMNADLSVILNTPKRLSPGAEDDPDSRARITQEWRQAWIR